MEKSRAERSGAGTQAEKAGRKGRQKRQAEKAGKQAEKRQAARRSAYEQDSPSADFTIVGLTGSRSSEPVRKPCIVA